MGAENVEGPAYIPIGYYYHHKCLAHEREESRLPYLRGRTPAAVENLARLLRAERLLRRSPPPRRANGVSPRGSPRPPRPAPRSCARTEAQRARCQETGRARTLVSRRDDRRPAGTTPPPSSPPSCGSAAARAFARARSRAAIRRGAPTRRASRRDALAVLGLGDAERGPARRRPRARSRACAERTRRATRGGGGDPPETRRGRSSSSSTPRSTPRVAQSARHTSSSRAIAARDRATQDNAHTSTRRRVGARDERPRDDDGDDSGGGRGRRVRRGGGHRVAGPGARRRALRGHRATRGQEGRARAPRAGEVSGGCATRSVVVVVVTVSE